MGTLAERVRNPSRCGVTNNASPSSCVGAGLPAGCLTGVPLFRNWYPRQSPVSSWAVVSRTCCCILRKCPRRAAMSRLCSELSTDYAAREHVCRKASQAWLELRRVRSNGHTPNKGPRNVPCLRSTATGSLRDGLSLYRRSKVVRLDRTIPYAAFDAREQTTAAGQIQVGIPWIMARMRSRSSSSSGEWSMSPGFRPPSWSFGVSSHPFESFTTRRISSSRLSSAS